MTADEARGNYDQAWLALQEARKVLTVAQIVNRQAWRAVEATRDAINEARESYDEAKKAFNEAWLIYIEASIKH